MQCSDLDRKLNATEHTLRNVCRSVIGPELVNIFMIWYSYLEFVCKNFCKVRAKGWREHLQLDT